jgi:hypothetical protein
LIYKKQDLNQEQEIINQEEQVQEQEPGHFKRKKYARRNREENLEKLRLKAKDEAQKLYRRVTKHTVNFNKRNINKKLLIELAKNYKGYGGTELALKSKKTLKKKIELAIKDKRQVREHEVIESLRDMQEEINKLD